MLRRAVDIGCDNEIEGGGDKGKEGSYRKIQAKKQIYSYILTFVS